MPTLRRSHWYRVRGVLLEIRNTRKCSLATIGPMAHMAHSESAESVVRSRRIRPRPKTHTKRWVLSHIRCRLRGGVIGTESVLLIKLRNAQENAFFRPSTDDAHGACDVGGVGGAESAESTALRTTMKTKGFGALAPPTPRRSPWYGVHGVGRYSKRTRKCNLSTIDPRTHVAHSESAESVVGVGGVACAPKRT